jgi:hypothetical protein
MLPGLALSAFHRMHQLRPSYTALVVGSWRICTVNADTCISVSGQFGVASAHAADVPRGMFKLNLVVHEKAVHRALTQWFAYQCMSCTISDRIDCTCSMI